MSSLSGTTLSRRSSIGLFDWDFIDITGAGDPLSTPNVQVPQSQTDFGNCKQSEEAVWSPSGQWWAPDKLVGCRDTSSGAVRYFNPSDAPSSGTSPCAKGQWLNPQGKCEGPGGTTTTPSKPVASGGGGYVAPKPADAPPVPVEAGMSMTSKIAVGLIVAAGVLVGVKVAKKRGYLRNEEECY